MLLVGAWVCVCMSLCRQGDPSRCRRCETRRVERLPGCRCATRPADRVAACGHACVPPDHQANGPAAPRRWGEVSGKHVDLQIGDICDWEFLSQAFEVGACCSERCAADPSTLC